LYTKIQRNKYFSVPHSTVFIIFISHLCISIQCVHVYLSHNHSFSHTHTQTHAHTQIQREKQKDSQRENNTHMPTLNTNIACIHIFCFILIYILTCHYLYWWEQQRACLPACVACWRRFLSPLAQDGRPETVLADLDDVDTVDVVRCGDEVRSCVFSECIWLHLCCNLVPFVCVCACL